MLIDAWYPDYASMSENIEVPMHLDYGAMVCVSVTDLLLRRTNVAGCYGHGCHPFSQLAFCPWPGRAGVRACFTIFPGEILERFHAGQNMGTITHWWYVKSIRIFQSSALPDFPEFGDCVYESSSTVERMQRLSPYSHTVSYLSTGLNM